MAIVKMRRLRLLAPSRVKGPLLKELSNYGCVEIESGDKFLGDENLQNLKALLQPPQDDTANTWAKLNEINASLTALNKFAPEKKPFFEPKPSISLTDLYNPERRATALAAAEEINACSREINSLLSEESRLEAKKLSLLPWEELELPLNFTGGSSYRHTLGVCPSVNSFEDLLSALEEIKECQLNHISSDRNQHYLSFICHCDSLDKAMEALKSKGFSGISFKDIEGSAKENISAVESRLAESALKREALAGEILAKSGKRALLEQTQDSLTLENTREKILSSQGGTKETTYMQGWIPNTEEEKITDVLKKQGCAYEFSDPQEGEEPPVLLKNSRLASPFGAITELYGLPGYTTIVDPTPFVAFFFFLFFGMMLSDAAYGLILASLTLFYLKKAQPTGATRRFILVAFFVGLSALGWGAIFGSWFGDVIPALSVFTTGQRINIPFVFDPLAEPMKMLILSLSLGVIHLFIGMGIGAYRLIKQGYLWDAVFDIGFWYLIIGGLILALLGFNPGLYIALFGALGVLFTAGRHKRNILGKLIGGLGALYGVTSYLSDILSYSRLMALGLATGVVASVVNTMGTLAGNGALGWVLFILVFLVGQTFNLAINLLGAFVHTCRLQYVEFFGKFFEGGGQAFNPLKNKTKYIRLMKEEN